MKVIPAAAYLVGSTYHGFDYTKLIAFRGNAVLVEDIAGICVDFTWTVVERSLPTSMSRNVSRPFASISKVNFKTDSVSNLSLRYVTS